jgi:hypothetical protein
MSRILTTLRREFILVLPPTIFFFVAFNVISITKALMLREHGIEFSGLATATVGALLVGKVILVADKIPIMNRFPEKPLIYNILWKTAIYVLAVFVVRYAEHLIPFLMDGSSVGIAHQQLLNQVVWQHFWSIQIWLIVLFFVYAGLHELVQLIGRETVLRLLFASPKPSER